jgi:hypothetical protein
LHDPRDRIGLAHLGCRVGSGHEKHSLHFSELRNTIFRLGARDNYSDDAVELIYGPAGLDPRRVLWNSFRPIERCLPPVAASGIHGRPSDSGIINGIRRRGCSPSLRVKESITLSHVFSSRNFLMENIQQSQGEQENDNRQTEGTPLHAPGGVEASSGHQTDGEGANGEKEGGSGTPH